MQINETYELPADVFSVLQPSCRYGSKGERVRVVSVLGEVAIVERMDLYRFPIRVKKLTGEEEIEQKDYNAVISSKKSKKRK